MYFIGQAGTNLEYQGWHINHTLWAYSGACPQDNTWIEIGDTQGGGPGNDYAPGYYYYWAYTTNWPYNYSGFIIGPSDNSGNNHAYELLYVGSATYQAWYTNSSNQFVEAAQVGGMGYGTCTGQAGEELSGQDGNDNLYLQHSDDFVNYPFGMAVHEPHLVRGVEPDSILAGSPLLSHGLCASGLPELELGQ